MEDKYQEIEQKLSDLKRNSRGSTMSGGTRFYGDSPGKKLTLFPLNVDSLKYCFKCPISVLTPQFLSVLLVVSRYLANQDTY